MTADQYVESVLAKYQVPRAPTSPTERLGAIVVGPLRTWAGQQLNALEYSGSYATETGVHGVSDVDVFISLKADTTNTLKEIYDSLYSLAQTQGWSPRQQNVSVGVTVNSTRSDLVPGKVQAGYQNYHSLGLRKRDSWTRDQRLAAHRYRAQLGPPARDSRGKDLADAPRPGLSVPVPRTVRDRRTVGSLANIAGGQRPPRVENSWFIPRVDPCRGPGEHQQRSLGRPDEDGEG